MRPLTKINHVKSAGPSKSQSPGWLPLLLYPSAGAGYNLGVRNTKHFFKSVEAFAVSVLFMSVFISHQCGSDVIFRTINALIPNDDNIVTKTFATFMVLRECAQSNLSTTKINALDTFVLNVQFLVLCVQYFSKNLPIFVHKICVASYAFLCLQFEALCVIYTIQTVIAEQ